MRFVELIEAVCTRMEAKPFTKEAVESHDTIERIVANDADFYTIMRLLEQAERRIRERDDSDVFFIG